MTEKQTNAWNRDQINVRLSKKRRAALRELARDLPSGATPTDALDLALERAAAVVERAQDLAHDLADVWDFARSDAERRASDAQTARDAMRAVASDVSALRELISAAATDLDEDAPVAESLRAWLDKQSRLRGSVGALVVAARWQRVERVDERIRIELRVRVVEASGAAAPRAVGLALARLPMLSAQDPLAGVSRLEWIALRCQRDEAGTWGVEAREINPDKTIGRLIGSARA